ncbi:MAG: hypothetical protein QM775_10440 [Pirellulales bacterium]
MRTVVIAFNQFFAAGKRRTRRNLGHSLTTALAVICVLVAGMPLQAATYLWDADGSTTGAQDGAGTWSTAGTTWWNAASAQNVAITSADIGFLGAGGTGGTITLNANQSVLGLIFGQTTTTGYTLTASAPATTLTLGTSGLTVLQGDNR